MEIESKLIDNKKIVFEGRGLEGLKSIDDLLK